MKYHLSSTWWTILQQATDVSYLEIAQATFLKVLSLQHVLFAPRPRLVDIAFQLELRCQMIQAFQPTDRQSHFFKITPYKLADNTCRFIYTPLVCCEMH